MVRIRRQNNAMTQCMLVRFAWVLVSATLLTLWAAWASAQTCSGAPAVGQGWAFQLDGSSALNVGPVTAPAGEVGAVVARGPVIGSFGIGRVSYRAFNYAGNYATAAIALQSPRRMSRLSACLRMAHQREISTQQVFEDFSIDSLSKVTSIGVAVGAPLRIGRARVVPFVAAARGRIESLTGHEGRFWSDGVTTAWAFETGLGVRVVSQLQLTPSITVRRVPAPAEAFSTFRLTIRLCPGSGGCAH